MNKSLTIFAIICLALPIAVSLHAMEAEASKYSLAHVIKPKNATDMITFVKKISDNHLVIFDRKGRGELWDLADKPTFIKEFSGLDIFSLENAFMYQDSDGYLLFIGYDDSWRAKLYVYNLANPVPVQPDAEKHEESEEAEKREDCPICLENVSKENAITLVCRHLFCKGCIIDTMNSKQWKNNDCFACPLCRAGCSREEIQRSMIPKQPKQFAIQKDEGFSYKKEELYVGHSFQLFQKDDGTLLMQNTKDNSRAEIYPRWENAKRQRYPFHETVLFEAKPIHDVSNIRICDEGIIVGSSKFQNDRQKWRLADDLFNTVSLTKEEKKQIGWECFEYVSYEGGLRRSGWKEGFRSVECYHKTLDGVLCCGHDGFVSIWVAKE